MNQAPNDNQAMNNAKHRGPRQRGLLWGGVIVVLLAAIIALVWVGKSRSNASENSNSTSTIDTTVQPNDHTKGNANAKVVLIEYSDFQCPACAIYFPIVKRLEDAYPNDLFVVYRHFPLKGRHANAEIAARASEAAGKQGKFFDMHDRLFEQQTSWASEGNPKDLFVSYAKELGLDTKQFETDLDSDEVKNRVDADYRNGIQGGINATPTFFVNGQLQANPNGYDGLKAAIDQALQNP